MAMAVMCGQPIKSIHISVLYWPLITYTEHYFVF